MESIGHISLKRESTGVGVFLTLSLAVPYIYHLINMKGIVFLPIFLGVIISTYFLSLPSVLTIAVLSPLLNHIVTGMPPTAPLPMMQLLILEGIVIGVTASLVRPKTAPTLRAAIPIIAGRLSSFMLIPFFAPLTPGVILNNLVSGFPGLLLNIIVSLGMYFYLRRR